MQLNQVQIAILKEYSDGDFAYLLEDPQHIDLDDLGDELLKFILIEVSGDGGCNSLDVAFERVTRAQKDLEAVYKILTHLEAELLSRTESPT